MVATNVSEISRNTPLQLDYVNQCARIAEESISLSPKAFSVLAYLAERPGRLVTKRELLDALWPDVHVTEGVLKRAVLEIRKALSDPANEPQFIETLHRRGYRLLSRAAQESLSAGFAPEQPAIAGRRQELLDLDGWLDEALAGSRQVCFITGEAGLGKTTLIDQFARRLHPNRLSIVRGGCLPQFGRRELLLPVFEAIDHLKRKMGPRLVDILRARAPRWLLQMPSLIPVEDRTNLQTGVLSSSPERMVREMAATLEALSVEVPLVLVLEDLQWSDPATIDLLSALAARSSAARLMIVATYRPAEAGTPGSRLRAAQNEMELHGQCRVLALECLSEQDTADYLATRFPAMSTATFAPALHERTSGNPLHMVSLCDELQRTGKPEAIWTLVPHTLQQMFERQAAQRSAPEQELLSAAAVATGTFSVAVIASVLGWTEDEAESHCEALVSQQVMLKRCSAPCSDLPRYGFVHALCRDALYMKIPSGRRARLKIRLSQAEQLDTRLANLPERALSVLFEQRSFAAFA